MRKFDPANLKLVGSLLVLVFLVASIAIIVKLTPEQRSVRPKAAVVSAGPNSCGGFMNNASGPGGASVSWTNTNGAMSSDNNWATAVVNAGTASTTYYLEALGCGFSIPAGSTINGILVEVERHRMGANATDQSVKLVKSGSVVGQEKGDLSTNWPLADAYRSYGGSSDLWGTSWGSADINASNFGIAFSGNAGLPPEADEILYVDHIRITVYYTPPPPSCSNECSASGAKQCADSTQYQTCGNYDADSCLEWSSSVSCPSGQTCSGSGVCSTSGGGTSGGGTKPGGGTKTGGGTKPSGSTGTLTTLQLNISVPYLIGGTKISVMMGSLSKEILVLPDKKDYSLDVKEANVSLGSSTTVVVGGNKTLIKKIQVTPTSESTAVNVGDLILGDITGDNKIDDKDTVSLLDSLANQTSKGDLNADKATNSLDWAILLAHFGKSGDL